MNEAKRPLLQPLPASSAPLLSPQQRPANSVTHTSAFDRNRERAADDSGSQQTKQDGLDFKHSDSQATSSPAPRQGKHSAQSGPVLTADSNNNDRGSKAKQKDEDGDTRMTDA